jgi:uncharacterized protein YndB with AHSA1/START domain
MPDIAIQIDTTADPAAAYAALTTTDGVAGWWTTRNQTSGAVGEVDRMWFPDAPMAWELRGDEMFRIVTLGWAQMLLQLRQYLDSGQPAPFFSF